MNVYDYFVDKLGLPPDDETLRQLPVASNCGADCKRAIDAAAAWIKEIRSAFGEETETEYSVIEHARLVASTYWRS